MTETRTYAPPGNLPETWAHSPRCPAWVPILPAGFIACTKERDHDGPHEHIWPPPALPQPETP